MVGFRRCRTVSWHFGSFVGCNSWRDSVNLTYFFVISPSPCRKKFGTCIKSVLILPSPCQNIYGERGSKPWFPVTCAATPRSTRIHSLGDLCLAHQALLLGWWSLAKRTWHSGSKSAGKLELAESCQSCTDPDISPNGREHGPARRNHLSPLLCVVCTTYVNEHV